MYLQSASYTPVNAFPRFNGFLKPEKLCPEVIPTPSLYLRLSEAPQRSESLVPQRVLLHLSVDLYWVNPRIAFNTHHIATGVLSYCA